MSEFNGVCWILDYYFYSNFSKENPHSMWKIDILTEIMKKNLTKEKKRDVKIKDVKKKFSLRSNKFRCTLVKVIVCCLT